MRALVLGAGRMGRAAAWDLARQPGVKTVRLVDRDPEALVLAERDVAHALLQTAPKSEARIEAQRYDFEDTQGLVKLLEGWDVMLSSSDYKYNETLTRAAIEAKCHMCD